MVCNDKVFKVFNLNIPGLKLIKKIPVKIMFKKQSRCLQGRQEHGGRKVYIRKGQ